MATRREILLRLYALQSWARVGNAKDEKPYAATWFYNQRRGFLNGIQKDNRKTVHRLIRAGLCVAEGCQKLIPIDSEGDHLIPVSVGGARRIGNYLPLCRWHNSSKGTKDLIEWWMFKKFTPQALSPDALCQYCRINWQDLPAEMLDDTCPDSLLQFCDALVALLPTDDHQRALLHSCENPLNTLDAA